MVLYAIKQVFRGLNIFAAGNIFLGVRATLQLILEREKKNKEQKISNSNNLLNKARDNQGIILG